MLAGLTRTSQCTRETVRSAIRRWLPRAAPTLAAPSSIEMRCPRDGPATTTKSIERIVSARRSDETRLVTSPSNSDIPGSVARITTPQWHAPPLQAPMEQPHPKAAQFCVCFAVHPVPGQKPPEQRPSTQPQPYLAQSLVSFSVQPLPSQ